MSQDNSILDNVQWQADSGAITFKDVRYMLIRPDTVVDLQKAVEAMVGPERCAEAMMAGGYTGGSRSSRRYKEVFNYTDQEIVAFMCQMGGEIGWGRFSLIELDAVSKRLVIEVAGSPFAEAYVGDGSQASKLPVCHMIRGVLAGLAAGIFGGDVAAEETDCVAKGDPICHFVIDQPADQQYAASRPVAADRSTQGHSEQAQAPRSSVLDTLYRLSLPGLPARLRVLLSAAKRSTIPSRMGTWRSVTTLPTGSR